MAFKPSKYQQKVYDFITKGKGNAVVSAVAGSGKTTTLLNALKLIPKNKTSLFLAFNKSIAKELSERVPEGSNTHVKTVHGFGMSSLLRDFSCDVFGGKYRKMLRDIMEFLQKDELSILKDYGFKTDEMKLVYDMQIDFEDEKIDNPKGYLNRVVELCDLGRLNLIDTDNQDAGIDELYKIAEKHNVDIVNGECFRAWILIKLGTAYTAKIDFTDMIYLPIKYNLRVWQYDFVFIDECQDLNACQRELMLRAVKPKWGRFVAVGDPHQAIYGFAGADSDSFDKLCAIPYTTKLPLSVCYRCGTEIIKKAQNIIPHIEAFEKAEAGTVDNEADLTMIQDRDMVLCRQTYPIVRLCLKMLSEGRKATIMGGDIGKSLIKMIEDTQRKSEEWTMQNVFNRLYKELEKVVNNLMRKEGLTKAEAEETQIYSVAKERIEVIEMLSKNCDKPQEVIAKIDKIFSDDSTDGIILSTIHKSKGLEADRVFIIHPELMPSKYARKAWELTQEENLRYVAYTRAKSYLGFISKDVFDAWSDSTNESRADKVTEVKESKWIGQVGKKESLQLTCTMMKEVSTTYGDTYLYEFVDASGNLFSKFGTVAPRFITSEHDEIEEGATVAFDATIKQHKEFKDEKVTVLSTLARYSK